MAGKQTKTAKRANSQNKTRSVESEVTTDSHARNLLESQPKLTPKSVKRQLSKQAIKKQQAKIRLYGAKNGKEYNESQLKIPLLNKAVMPGVKVKSGKKGKKFVDEKNPNVLNLLVKTINDKYDKVNESKLEKARRLEEIRELKRKEMDKKEQEKKIRLMLPELTEERTPRSPPRTKISLCRPRRRVFPLPNPRNPNSSHET
ncbi:hypothetical protein CANTEDRAFT_114064 [Yamadazyma tenuis ATCC 10573]|uniref:60S ribosomal subunit assembly/export protein LOC1 n=1 Tax=Candida tenuis (strain ATCC 10573 / BCRC 21748 / CBS 615 / JCM 9827 / NBRC 10315 / NRRL Y-1498 / VKM Y-70) TaxID=590646 RepID=G3B502_CANTC|nr:uncharacterized protein CANTEDRAFT_114064 [Yamadazyma tenuis ATCC 10573]EGV64333.1 hypothetical protein CANTEDRAFT_114064 [Yamadazyma tenuis ATCC 10573]